MWRSVESTTPIRPSTPVQPSTPIRPSTPVQPSTPRVSVTELSGSGQINPTPAVPEDSDRLVGLYLSLEKLKELAGAEDLGRLLVLEMCVDTRENTLGNFGSYLPSLVHLKLNNSTITSVRDLGTTLPHLQALWMSRCGLADLDGIPSFTCLKELYVAYNGIWDLSPVSMLEQLQVLDLEGNGVDDLIQVQYLGLCSQLSDLTLEGNPVCTRPHPGPIQTEGYRYRTAVRELIPQLRYLDNVPAGDTEPCCDSATAEDWVRLRESLKDSAPAEEEEPASVLAPLRPGSAPTRPGSAQRPVTALPALLSLSRPSSARPGSSPSCSSPFARPGSSPSSRPGSSPSSRPGSSPSSRPGSASSSPALLDQDASGLTHGVGGVICGNPVQVLRAHRQKMGIPAPMSHPPSLTPPTHTPEHTFDLEETDGKDRRDVFSELRAWRKEHSRRLQAIEQERKPQVMKISHSDEDEGGEEDGMGHSLSFTSDEEEEEEEGVRAVCGRLINTTSPDSSFNSPPPDLLCEREAASPEVSRLSLFPDPPLSPSPPPAAAAPPGGQSRAAGVRARRVRVKAAGGADCGAPAAEERREEGIPKIHRALGTPRGASLRPLSSPALHSPSAEAGGSHEQPISRHPPVIQSSAARPPLQTRPLTARAVLQRLPNRLELPPRPGPAHYGGGPSH
ncbi:leucine-rich repeat-containing protein 56 [Anguilla anguilla]|uniref:leucine-rich repeat-containing protein 56 n=1 Tax=Anguilla anguilla TaxID=7936 RepID=UPI0015AC2433|nr:leucine-rich repeat-containing protein 56 [Anguilla anguilla]